MKIGNIHSASEKQLVSKKTGELFTIAKSLTDTTSIESLIVNYEILNSGHRASASHYHTLKDEIILILEGFPTLIVNETRENLKPGDFVGFKAIDKESHFLVNDSENIVVFLSIGSNPKTDEVCYT